MALIQTLKDSNFRIIGYIYDEGDMLVIKDDYFRIKGYYDKKGDVTKDDYFRIIGYGNLLTTLL